jgi:hypothetical protein
VDYKEGRLHSDHPKSPQKGGPAIKILWIQEDIQASFGDHPPEGEIIQRSKGLLNGSPAKDSKV